VKPVLQKLARYGLWLISTGISIYCYLLFRGMNLLLMQSIGWNHHLINLMDKVAMLIIGLIVIAVIILIQHLYTEHGWGYFLAVTAVQLVLYTVIQFLNFKLGGGLLPADYLVFLLLLAAAAGLWCAYSNLQHKKYRKTTN